MYACVYVLVFSVVSNSSDCSPPGSSLHGILQARILEWVAILFSRGSFRPRDQTRVSVSCVSCIGSWSLSHQGIPHCPLFLGNFFSLSLFLPFLPCFFFSFYLSHLSCAVLPPSCFPHLSLLPFWISYLCPITVLSSASSSGPSDLSLSPSPSLFSLNVLFSPSLPHPFLFLSFFEFNTPCLYLLKYR